MKIRLNSSTLLGGTQEWYIPAKKYNTLLLTIGATGGFRFEENVMIATPMKKHVKLLVRNLNRAAI